MATEKAEGVDLSYQAVYKAIEDNDAGRIRWLYKAGANLDEYNQRDNRTLLYCAVMDGRVEAVQALVDAGADVNRGHKWDSETPLHAAVRTGQLSIAEILLAWGADVNLATMLGYTPLHTAACHGLADIVKLLCKQPDIDLNLANPFFRPSTPLLSAIVCRHTEVVRELCRAGASLSAVDGCGQLPLHEAAQEGNFRAVEVLLEAGALASAKDNDGKTPRECIVQGREGASECQEMLLQAEQREEEARKVKTQLSEASTPASARERPGSPAQQG